MATKVSTGYGEEVDTLLTDLVEGITRVLETNLAGLYLFGSLTYGDFRPERSDVDLVAVVRSPLDEQTLVRLEKMHANVAAAHPVWAERVEVSYTPAEMFSSHEPPAEPRPWFGFGRLYREATYRNEWRINNYLLRKYGIALIGASPASFIAPIAIEHIQRACILDLRQEWLPKRADEEWLANSHYLSYLVLNLCRILYTVLRAETASKGVAAQWTAATFPDWAKLIAQADAWRYGIEWTARERERTLAFLGFVADEVARSPAAQRDAV